MKESNEKIVAIQSAEALQYIDSDCRFVAKQIAVIQKHNMIDESTGEVITLDTIGNVLFEKGHELSQNDISALLFHFQVGDIEEIHLSNKRRLGTVQGKAKEIWTVKARKFGVNKTQKLMLKANNILQAYEIAKDYIELNCKGFFAIESINTFTYSTLIEPKEKEDGETNIGKCWYKLEMEVSNQRIDCSHIQNFVVYAENADEAKQIVNDYVDLRNIEKNVDDLLILRTKTAQPISYDIVVPNEFCQAYNEYKEEE